MMPVRVVGCGLLGLGVTLLVVGAASAWQGATRLTARADDSAAVEAAAAAFVTAYGTFDYRRPADYMQRLAPLTSGALGDAMSRATVAPDATDLRRTTATDIESVSVTAWSGTDATASVTSVQQRRWMDPVLGRSVHASVRQRVTCQLVRVNGDWLVAALRLEAEESVRAEAR